MGYPEGTGSCDIVRKHFLTTMERRTDGLRKDKMNETARKRENVP